MERIRPWIVGGAAALAFVLLLQNQEAVTTRLLFWSVEAPRFLLLGLVFLVGGAAGFFLGRRSGG